MLKSKKTYQTLLGLLFVGVAGILGAGSAVADPTYSLSQICQSYASQCGQIPFCAMTAAVSRCVKMDPKDDYPIDCSMWNDNQFMCQNRTLDKCGWTTQQSCVATRLAL